MVVFLENPPYFLIKQTKKYFALNISYKSKKKPEFYVVSSPLCNKNKLLLMTFEVLDNNTK